jgi:uncharacterized protein YndB with AHSA1/START domain
MIIEKKVAVNAAEQDLHIERLFDAPPEVLWAAWTVPERQKRWYGPKTYTTPLSSMDFRVGGSYLLCMRSPDGKDFYSTGKYREIVPRKRIVCTDSFSDAMGNVVPASYYGMTEDFPLELLVTISFEDQGGVTKMVLTHEGVPMGEMREATKTGWNESFDKLALLLREEGYGARPGRLA